ncbi:MAG: hypothetical protein V1799_05160 [bacterium]
MGGGQGSYSGYRLPQRIAANENATYSATPSAESILFLATSALTAKNTLTVSIDSLGRFGGWKYSGDFAK